MANNGHIKKLLGGRQLFMVPALCLKNFGTMGAWDLDARIESGTGKKLLRTRRDTFFCQEITRKCASTAKKSICWGTRTSDSLHTSCEVLLHCPGQRGAKTTPMFKQ